MSFTKTKTTLAILLASLGAGAAGMAVAAAHEGGRKAEIMSQFDTNHDGKLDEAEKQAMREHFKAMREQRQQQMLARFDANHDGKLDAAERQTMRTTLAAERFKKLDTNGDGVLSLQEFEAGAAQPGFGFGHRFGGGMGGFGGRHKGDGPKGQ
jgi:5-hydroxyisourate hydrolase-like protein (transthyretin family)